MSDLSRGLKGLKDSRPGYEKAQAQYEGTIGEVFMTDAIADMLDDLGEVFRLNFAAAPVDKLAQRIELNGITLKRDEDTKKLQLILDENDFEKESKLTILKSLMFGDAYLFVWPAPDFDTSGRIEIFYNSPLVMRAMYSEENPRQIAYAIKLWSIDRGDNTFSRVNLIYPDRVERLISKTGKSDKSHGELEYDAKEYVKYAPDPTEDTPDPESDVPNEFDLMPVFHLAHDGNPYGVPAHIRAYGPQNAISKIVITQMSNFEANGFPQRYALLDPEGVDDGGENWDDEVNIPDTDDAVETRRGKSKLKNEPGTMQMLAGVKSVGTFDPTDPENFLKPAAFYIEALAMLTDTPLDEVYKTGNPESGAAKRSSRDGINSKANAFKASATRFFEGVAELVATMAGISDTKATVAWRPTDRTTDLDGWQIVAAKIAAGVPLRAALEEAGYDTEEVAKWYPEDGPAFSPTEIARLSTALQALSAAKMGGVVTLEQITRLLPSIYDGTAALEDNAPPRLTAPPASLSAVPPLVDPTLVVDPKLATK